MKQSYKRPKIYDVYDAICEELEINNLNYLENENDNDCLLIEKIISFADVTTSRKLIYLSKDKDFPDSFSAEKIEERIKKNISFYTSYDEMKKWELSHSKEKVFYCQTKQASIYLPTEFYKFMSVPDPTTRHKEDSNFEKQYKLNNDKIKVFLCNTSIQSYFDKNLTQKLYEKLKRKCNAHDLELQNGNLTEIDLHVTPHGIGTTDDIEFAKVRDNVFAKDKMIILVKRIANDSFNVYIAFYRNPKFYLLNNIYNKDYIISKYSEEQNNKTGQESRKGQSKWRDELAELALALSIEDEGFVECPFTGVKVQYPSEASFLRASHIKAYSKCKDARGNLIIEEAYDLDNGFLVCADVDALFDKYLISVDPSTRKIVKSPTLSKSVLKHLALKEYIDDRFITANKIKYLMKHYEEFINRNIKTKK